MEFLEVSAVIGKADESAITPEERAKIEDGLIELVESVGCTMAGGFELKVEEN